MQLNESANKLLENYVYKKKGRPITRKETNLAIQAFELNVMEFFSFDKWEGMDMSSFTHKIEYLNKENGTRKVIIYRTVEENRYKVIRIE